MATRTVTTRRGRHSERRKRHAGNGAKEETRQASGKREPNQKRQERRAATRDYNKDNNKDDPSQNEGSTRETITSGDNNQ